MKPFLFLYHLSSAFSSLRANKLRTSLTVLGVTIGISCIIVILSLSAGATQVIQDQVDDLGGAVAVVRPGIEKEDLEVNDLTATLAGSRTVTNLTEADLDDIQSIKNVSAAAPLMIIDGSVAAGDNEVSSATIVSTTPDFPDVTPLTMSDGQFIDSVTKTNTAVVGPQLAVELYGTEQAIGRTFKTHGISFTIIGVLKRTDNPINYNHVDFDNAAIIDLESGKLFNQNVAAFQQINIRADSERALGSIMDEANKAIERNHLGERDFMILAGDDLSRPSSELFYAIGTTLSVVAAVSLVVGGIGIMNIMLVSVAERTREIGIRKALGASIGHIVWQFMLESMVMSLAGGLLGYIVGYVVAFGIARTFLTFIPIFNWQIAAMALGIAVFVGVAFGLYPAIRAARKDPIASLRQYH